MLPSLVVHVRNLPDMCQAADVAQALQTFGIVTYVLYNIFFSSKNNLLSSCEAVWVRICGFFESVPLRFVLLYVIQPSRLSIYTS